MHASTPLYHASLSPPAGGGRRRGFFSQWLECLHIALRFCILHYLTAFDSPFFASTDLILSPFLALNMHRRLSPLRSFSIIPHPLSFWPQGLHHSFQHFFITRLAHCGSLLLGLTSPPFSTSTVFLVSIVLPVYSVPFACDILGPSPSPFHIRLLPLCPTFVNDTSLFLHRHLRCRSRARASYMTSSSPHIATPLHPFLSILRPTVMASFCQVHTLLHPAERLAACRLLCAPSTYSLFSYTTLVVHSTLAMCYAHLRARYTPSLLTSYSLLPLAHPASVPWFLI